MRVTRTKCDQCGKETTDRYLEPGWIEIGPGTIYAADISVSVDRRKDGMARTGYWSGKRLDLCCTACLVKFINKLVKKRKKKDGK